MPMEREWMRHRLPEKPPDGLVAWTKKHYREELGEEYLVFRSVRVPVSPPLEEIMATNSLKPRYEWAAECTCSACHETFITQKITHHDGIRLAVGEDSMPYTLDPGEPLWRGDYTNHLMVEDAFAGEKLVCPMCLSEVELLHSRSLRGGRTKRIMVQAVQNVEGYTAVIYWMVYRHISEEGFDYTDAEPIRSRNMVGALRTDLVHPKQLAPQPGVYTGIDDSDWVIIKYPTTKEAVWRRHGVKVYDQHESEPEVRAAGEWDHSDDAVTQYIGYARNDDGGIDKYSWVNNVELLDEENYQARRLPTCVHCGRVRPMKGQVLSNNVYTPELNLPDPEAEAQVAAGRAMAEAIAGTVPEGDEFLQGVTFAEQAPVTYDGGACPWCGGDEWE